MRIGIITFYYNSHNYGGILQAFALQKYLEKKGMSAEQICYVQTTHPSLKYLFMHSIKSIGLLKRNIRFAIFRKRIPHSKIVYNKDSISGCLDNYDVLIAGSDQIWNPDWIEPAYYLNFEKPECVRISYAASLGKDKLDDTQKDLFRDILPLYSRISVRENKSVAILSELTDKQINCVLDPVFLLEEEDWSSICSDPVTAKKYIYCHFIGNDLHMRDVVSEYAKKKGLLIVNIPSPSHHNSNDDAFGDINVTQAGPKDFISLIRNANIVFTDSFHCCAFSAIFKKNCFAFHRENQEKMATRIISLFELINAQDHFCDTEEKIDCSYFDLTGPIDYSNSKIEDARFNSKAFLNEAMGR